MQYRRISRYYPGVDGTRLAVDLYLPETEEKVPFLLKAGYDRRRHQFESEKGPIERFLASGYAVAIVEVRGAGVSFGHSDGFFGLHDGKDLACVIEQLAAEPWCNGVCGMYGGSNYGMSQEITAVQQPQPLRAIAACDCSMDFYDQDFPNGVSALPEQFQAEQNAHAEPANDPVDDDPEGVLARAAEKEHERNLPFLAQHVQNMFRDDVNPWCGYRPNLDVPAWERMDTVRFGHVQSYAMGAWFDPGCTNKILTYKSWGGKLLLGPWPHTGMYWNANDGLPNAGFDWEEEHLRYFDFHLKNKDNGFADEPPVRYYTIGDDGNEWKYEEDFPVEGTMFAKWHLSAETAVAPEAVEDAVPSFLLCEEGATAGQIDYQVRNDVMIYGPGLRMNRNVKKDMREEDRKSIVFTSAPLDKPMEITGVPVMELYVKSSFHDGNFIVVLEEVTPDGSSHFLTEGVIRASHAKVHRNNIYESMGLPYHRGFREDRGQIPRQGGTEAPLHLAFHLEALSRVVAKGSAIRVSISCGGSGYQQPEGFPGTPGNEGAAMPTITLYTGPEADSVLTLPTVKPWRTRFRADDGTEVWIFKTALYLRKDGRFCKHPVTQVHPVGKIGEEHLVYEAERLIAEVKIRPNGENTFSELVIRDRINSQVVFAATGALPERYLPKAASPEIPLPQQPGASIPDAAVKTLYVATAPVPKGAPGNMNPMLRRSFDLFVSLIYPSQDNCPADENIRYPVIVNIHGFGGSHHQFEHNTCELLKRGYAVASMDYRLTPPCTWEAPVHDAKACVRYLKAHAQELSLDPERVGIIGGSMGGYLAGMLAADNGAPEWEGTIGGNGNVDSSVRASVTMFGPMDLMHFGDDVAEIWPDQPGKRDNGDGPFAPPASMIGHVGIGKGIADLKQHLTDPAYAQLLSAARMASPVSHVTANSAPICLVHGIYDCVIQVPMGQSVRMFNAYSRTGAKALLLCNNNGMYGADPEIAQAMLDFLTNRV